MLVKSIYKTFEIILFAIEVTVLNETKIFLNPTEYLFEDYMHYGYVIAKEYPDIEQL